MTTEGKHFVSTTLTAVTCNAVGEILSLSLSGRKRDAIDVSSNSSANKIREFVSGMADEGEIQVSALYDGGNDTAYNHLNTCLRATANDTWTITWADGSTFVCDGMLTSLSVEGSHEDKITCSFTIKLSGKGTFTAHA